MEQAQANWLKAGMAVVGSALVVAWLRRWLGAGRSMRPEPVVPHPANDIDYPPAP